VTKAEKRLESESESLKKEPKPEQGIATMKEIWDQFTEGKKRIRNQTVSQEGTPKKKGKFGKRKRRGEINHLFFEERLN
jgi:predicted P-loop ATPase